MPISEDKEETSERLEELADSSTSSDSSGSSEPLLGNDDPGKAVMQGTVDDKNDRQKVFSISLSRKEIEEDLLKITGRKPTFKPRMIPKIMQKQRDALFPGLGLPEITKDMLEEDD
ncbi:hypothetical protein MA16_Dca026697 [Dendrobium catenatum]|uniref:Uncharacterized protein n=1 Tax=Dendrobium catenatum TaxID=906689 RepID=A0A2I0WDP8_9ASPA|nr:hypothetical protein MA16_Dca026697 [Dendrobium catenatum]